MEARYMLLGEYKLSESGRALKITIPRKVAKIIGVDKGDTAILYYDRKEKLIIIEFSKGEKEGEK